MSLTTRIPKIPEDQITPSVAQLLEIIKLQIDEIQLLKDEIARLKGQKPKPDVKPSALGKQRNKGNNRQNKSNRKKKRKSKTKNIEIHDVVTLKPENIPEGSIFKDHQDYVVQDLIIGNWNTCYRRQRWQTPSGDDLYGQLPANIKGSHFGPTMTAFILYQYHGCGVTQPLIKEQLDELGVQISVGQINNILVENKDRFHAEKENILSMALKLSGHINVDDTGARHKGKNGYCTHIGNDFFAWFETTPSKSRINFLKLLRCEHRDFVINDQALSYMQQQKMPQFQLSVLSRHNNKILEDETRWNNFLKRLKIKTERHKRIATEGALIGSLMHHDFNPELVIVSDDAGQFNVFRHALCWVHAERAIQKIIGFTTEQNKHLEDVKTDVWQFYNDLKAYRQQPDAHQKAALENRFDALFTRKTGFTTLDNALGRIYGNKSELLLVLERPDIPLHNNLFFLPVQDRWSRRLNICS